MSSVYIFFITGQESPGRLRKGPACGLQVIAFLFGSHCRGVPVVEAYRDNTVVIRIYICFSERLCKVPKQKRASAVRS